MAEKNTAPAAGNAPDLTEQLRTLTGVVTELANGQKTLAEALVKQQPAAVASAAAADKSANEAGVKYLTEDRFKELLREDRQQQQQASQQTAARDAFINDKLKDVKEKLPELLSGISNDPAKFTADEQAVRRTYQERLAALGVKAGDVGGGSAAGDGGTKAAEVVDTSKLSGVQLIDLAVKQSTPTPVSPAATGAPATAAATTATAAAAK